VGSRAIIKADILGEDDDGLDAAGRSKQVPEDVWDYEKTGAKEPPYNLEALAQFLEINTFHARCCKAKAIVTAGLGFDFVVPEGVASADAKNRAVLQEFFAYPNEEMTWGEILENALTDFEALGNGYFEVVRNRFGIGPPRAIYHVPAVTMRVRKDKRGFIQRRGMKTAYFRKFGTNPTSVDAFDPRDRDKPPGRRRLCHEIIHLKNYHPRSTYYGLPDFLPAMRALVGNKMAGDFNIQFFENNAVPQYAIIVKGGELARGARKRIEEYFRQHIKGQAHKTLFLEVPTEEGEKVDVEIQPLAVEIKDSSFRMFRSDNAEEIRVAHGVPGRLIGLTEKGGLGGSGEGTSQQEIFKYHVIEPKQTRLEYRINNFLIKRGFGIRDWEIRFREIDVTDEAKVAEIVQKLVHLGVLTINEGRHEMGYKPFEHKGAEIPFIMASAGPMCLDMLVEGGVRPMNMPPPAGAETEQGKRLIDSLLSIRKELHGELARRMAG
jgi:PBSX family phage portal protein